MQTHHPSRRCNVKANLQALQLFAERAEEFYYREVQLVTEKFAPGSIDICIHMGTLSSMRLCEYGFYYRSKFAPGAAKRTSNGGKDHFNFRLFPDVKNRLQPANKHFVTGSSMFILDQWDTSHTSGIDLSCFKK
jgi:hypothetical protein